MRSLKAFECFGLFKSRIPIRCESFNSSVANFGNVISQLRRCLYFEIAKQGPGMKRRIFMPNQTSVLGFMMTQSFLCDEESSRGDYPLCLLGQHSRRLLSDSWPTRDSCTAEICGESERRLTIPEAYIPGYLEPRPQHTPIPESVGKV